MGPLTLYAMTSVNWAELYVQHIERLQARYAQELAACGYDAVVVHSGAPQKRTVFDDQYWPLRVTPHFQHWLPLAEADCAVVIAAGKQPKLIWPTHVSYWEKPAAIDSTHWQSSFEIVRTTKPEAAAAELPRGRVAFIGQERERAASWGFADEDVSPKQLVEHLDQLRTVKSDYEIACLAEANRLAAPGHLALAQAFREDDLSELDLHLLYLRATGQDDPETPYKNIVAIGENAATLHHVSYRRTPVTGSGSRGRCWSTPAPRSWATARDITRTYVKGRGASASAFASLVASVETLQQKLCSRGRRRATSTRRCTTKPTATSRSR